MTVRLAQDMGMPLIVEYSKRFGVYDDLLPVLAMSLGAGETTLIKMAAAYSALANGGKQVRPTLIDRIQDRWGHTIWRHDKRECTGCKAEKWQGQAEPALIDDRRQIIDPHTAYQMTSIMEGVVQRGTATIIKQIIPNVPIAGKTGTTNDEKDAWFIGYTPDLVVGVFLGYDTPRHLGKGTTGGQLAAPIFANFLKLALADKKAAPFRIPPGIKLARVSLRTGLRAQGGGARLGDGGVQAHEEPDDAYSVDRLHQRYRHVLGARAVRQPARPERRTQRLLTDGLERCARAFTAAAHHPISRPSHCGPIATCTFEEAAMRAEAQKHADAVRQSLALLRRHL